MFWITVGQARRHTAVEIGPSTIDRSNFDFGETAAAGAAAFAGTSAAAVACAAAAAGEEGGVVRMPAIVSAASGECVAGRGVPALESFPEPGHALLRRPMSEPLWHDAA